MSSYEALLEGLVKQLQPNDTVVIMSNGSFGGLHHRLLVALNQKDNE
jgi:UDP-N-acetylmuramate: L-alanyl-gamma-D-glutamyl-meso-diaminopimelate ligase